GNGPAVAVGMTGHMTPPRVAKRLWTPRMPRSIRNPRIYPRNHVIGCIQSRPGGALATRDELSFGDLLRQHRRAAGLTQGRLAERAGLSARGIADLERGARRTPRRETLQRLAAALDLSDSDRSVWLSASRPRASFDRAVAAGLVDQVQSARLSALPTTP